MDQNIQAKHKANPTFGSQESHITHVDLGSEEIVELSDVDKRLLMYKNMRTKLLQELEKNKQALDKAKMEEINRKIEALEKA